MSTTNFDMKGCLAALLLVASPAFAQITAIRAGSVIDPARGTTAKDQVILIENGKIKAVGAGIAIPGGAEILDLSREWVTPGLMDAHTHMTLTEIGGDAPFESFYLNQSSTLPDCADCATRAWCCKPDSRLYGMSGTVRNGR